VTLLYALKARLTILRQPASPATDPQALALAALGWVLAQDDRAGRLLALTGLTSNDLRSGLDDRAVLSAVIEFLCAHEPDLVAAAEALGVEPQQLAAAKENLES
jgi:predicted component of type VI protein secretion system